MTNEVLTKIKQDFLSARKARDTDRATYLSTVIGEIEQKAVMTPFGTKEVSDTDLVAVLKSFHKKASEFLNIEVLEDSVRIKVGTERLIIEEYLPKQLEDSEIHMILLRSGTGKNLGAMMKYLKDNFEGRYDGKTASRLAKEIADS